MEFSITEVPLFFEYFYNYLKQEGTYDVSKEFLRENVTVCGYCKCGEVWCSTVALSSKKPFIELDEELPNEHQSEASIHLHVDDKNIPFEFESVWPRQEYHDELQRVCDEKGFKNQT